MLTPMPHGGLCLGLPRTDTALSSCPVPVITLEFLHELQRPSGAYPPVTMSPMGSSYSLGR